MEWEPTMITTQLIPAVLAQWSKNRGKLVFVMQSWGNIASFLGNASRGPNAERLLSRTYVQRNRLRPHWQWAPEPSRIVNMSNALIVKELSCRVSFEAA